MVWSRAFVVLVQDDPYPLVGRTQIAALALKHRLPAIGGTIEIAVLRVDRTIH
jgi:hypothetical protein